MVCLFEPVTVGMYLRASALPNPPKRETLPTNADGVCKPAPTVWGGDSETPSRRGG